MSLVPEMLSVPEITFVPRKVRSLVLCEAMAGKTSEMATATSMCERSAGRERQNAGQNQTDQ